MINEYLAKLHFTEKERVIYLAVAELGVQPASVIAHRTSLDRITTYKHLKILSERGFIKTFFRDGIQCFGVENFGAIENYLEEQVDEYKNMIKGLPTAINILQSLKGSKQEVPRLQVFEGDAGVKSLFRDMLQILKSENLRQLRVLSSNTYEERVSSAPLSKTIRSFFQDVGKLNVEVDLFEATGGMVPERVRGIPMAKLSPDSIPVASGTTNIFIAGSTVYLACYKGNPVAVKIQHHELSQIFHFLLDFLGQKVGL